MYTTKQFLITILITAIVFTGIGFFLSSKTNVQTKAPAQNKNTFQAGWDAAKQRLIEIGHLEPMFMEGQEIKTVRGEVAEVKGNKINVKIHPLEPLADIDLDNRIIEVDSQTKITLRVPKDEEQLTREMREFDKKMREFEERMMKEEEQYQTGGEGALPEPPEPIEPPEMMHPESFIIKTGTIADIKQGMNITATAAENIKDAKEFKAVEVVVE